MATTAAAAGRERVAVISGGSSGIRRDREKLRRLEAAFPGVHTSVCDMADAGAIRAFAALVQAFRPGVDLLVSNAGLLCEIDFGDSAIASAELLGEVVVNLADPIQLIASFMPALRAAAPSRIIVVTSGYALAPATRVPVYSAAKAGLRGFCKALRRQLAGLGIVVTEVVPPLVDTLAVRHRSGAKLPPDAVVRAALDGARRGRAEVLPGSVRWLPPLLRIAPGLAKRLGART